MAPDLADFLREGLRAPFDWRTRSCLDLAADWLIACGYPDARAPWAGRWSDEASARALLARCGGLDGLMREAAVRIGLSPTHAVRRGDIGAVEVLTPAGVDLAAGIWTGRRWVVRGPGGLWGGPATIRAAWRVEV